MLGSMLGGGMGGGDGGGFSADSGFCDSFAADTGGGGGDFDAGN